VRSLKKITLPPGAKRGELAATLHGDLQFPVEQAMNTLATITV
jgi:hypothetical protein